MSERRPPESPRRLMPWDEALETVLAAARPLGAERVPLAEAGGRLLASDVFSDIDMPPFDKAAMDGYACRARDLERPLRIVETIHAGSLPERPIGAGECASIMTGAPVPPGADTVVMIEHTERDGDLVRVVRRTGAENLCRRGEDVRAGELVLRAGALVGAAEAAVLASVGADPVEVTRRPRLGIASTGDELVEASRRPAAGMIRDSNSPQLMVQARAAGFPARPLGIVADTKEALEDLLQRHAESFDVLLFSGGVSAGERDHVPAVLEEQGFALPVHGVAVKPGRPLLFGTRGDAYVFGLPGNPVSTFVLFEVLVRPFLQRLAGGEYVPPMARARLTRPIERRRSDRLDHVPVVLDPGGGASPVEYHGSAHIHAYCAADGILRIPPGVPRIEAGETVSVILVR